LDTWLNEAIIFTTILARPVSGEVQQNGKGMVNKDLIGAPGRIRICDPLVRSLVQRLGKSKSCAYIFWPNNSLPLRNINNLAMFFGPVLRLISQAITPFSATPLCTALPKFGRVLCA